MRMSTSSTRSCSPDPLYSATLSPLAESKSPSAQETLVVPTETWVADLVIEHHKARVEAAPVRPTYDIIEI